MLFWLSHHNVMGDEVLKPNSFSSLLSQMATQVHLTRVMNSDSQKDLDVEVSFLRTRKWVLSHW